jgi:WD40 repeat protein
MRNAKEFTSARSAIKVLQVIQDKYLALCTEHHGIRLYDIESKKALIQVAHPYLNAQTTALAFSPDGKLVAFYTHPDIHVIHLENRQLLKSINITNDAVTQLCFDLSSTYILAGTQNGRVFQYRYNEDALLYRLCSFAQHPKLPNSILSIALHANLMACSSASGELCLLNLYAKTNKTFTTPLQEPITSLTFTAKSELIMATTNGAISLHTSNYFADGETFKTSLYDLKEIYAIEESSLLLLLRINGSLELFDTHKQKILHQSFLQTTKKISCLTLYNKELFVAFDNHEVYHISLYDTKDLQSHILHNSLDKAYKLVQSNPLLRSTKLFIDLEAKYETLYQHAINGLKNQNKEALKILLNHFSKVHVKKEELLLLEQTYAIYPKFHTLVLERNYALAYAMSTRYPALQKTYPYLKMEETFKIAFTNAQRHLLLQRKDEAASLLQPYMTIASKRAFIKLMLTQNRLFISYLKAVEKRNFTLALDIVKANPIFTQMPNYKTLQERMQSTLDEGRKHLDKGRVKEAKESFEKLADISKYKEQIAKLIMACDAMTELQSAYEKNDFVTCYTLLDAHKELYSCDLAKLLERHWIKLMGICEEHALGANIAEIKATLKEFLQIPSRKEKIGDLLRVSFHTKITMLITSQEYRSAENIIYSYIDIFGDDTEMRALKKLYEESAKQRLAITLDTKRKDSWIEEPFL